MRARLAAIEAAAEQAIGINEYEGLLEDLLDYLESGAVDRRTAADALVELTAPGQLFPWGAIETLEFTMHKLRWPEVREALLSVKRIDPDLHRRHLAGNILQAFDDDWPAAEIYRAYR